MLTVIRTILAVIISPILYLTGFRFSKDYRWGISCFHRFVYRFVDTIKANQLAGL